MFIDLSGLVYRQLLSRLAEFTIIYDNQITRVDGNTSTNRGPMTSDDYVT